MGISSTTDKILNFQNDAWKSYGVWLSILRHGFMAIKHPKSIKRRFGEEVNLCISSLAEHRPRNYLSLKSAKGRMSCFPGQQAYIDELKKKIKALKNSCRQGGRSVKSNAILTDYMNARGLRQSFKTVPRYGVIRNCPLKKKSVSSFLIRSELYDLVRNVQLRMI